MTTLNIRVKPNAKQQKLEKAEDGSWIISLQSPPVDGKANQELIKFLSKQLKIPKSHIHIVSGHTARLKRIEIKE